MPETGKFDGERVWATLNPGLKQLIGALTLEMFVAARTAAVAEKNGDAAVGRACDQASTLLLRRMEEELERVLGPADQNAPLIPSVLEDFCRVCGCSEQDACDDGGTPCRWTAPGLCSACAPRALEQGVPGGSKPFRRLAS